MEVKLIHVSNRAVGLGHTLHTFNLSLALLLGQIAQTANIQPNRLTQEQCSFSSWAFPFLAICYGQSPYATIARRIPLYHNALLQQHGQSCPATKHDILCCSASISFALIHLNTPIIWLQYNLNMAQNISIQAQCSSMQLQYSIPTS